MRYLVGVWVLLLFPSMVQAQPFIRVLEGEPVTEVGISQGVSWGDYDQDGDLDLFVANAQGASSDVDISNPVDPTDRLYRNNGDGTFTSVLTDVLSGFTDTSNLGTWIDYDNDGWLDLFINTGFAAPSPNVLLHNQGNGSFEVITSGPLVEQPMNTLGTSWADYDGDGDLDVFAPTVFANPNYLYRNEGEGAFVPVADVPFVRTNQNSQMGTWIDYDSDGDEDLYLINFSINSNTNQVFRNHLRETGIASFEKDSTVTMVTDNDIDYAFGANWIDYDNDGDLDGYLNTLFIGNRNGLYRRDGPALFARVANFRNQAASDGFSTAASCWADYDNDGDLDLINVVNKALANPSAFGIGTLEYYSNDGMGELQRRNVGLSASGYFYACAPADYDSDGDLDLYIAVSGTNSINDGGANLLYRNDAANGNWISIDLRGQASNTFGIGAKVWVRASINGQPSRQLRHISGNPSTLRGQASYRVHVGLGDAALIDEVLVEWPAGTVDRLTNVPANQHLTIVEGSSAVTAESLRQSNTITLEAAYPNPVTTHATLAYNLPEPTSIRIVVTDLLGRTVHLLQKRLVRPGRHRVQINVADWAPGVYFYRLETPLARRTGHLVVVR